MRFVVLAVLSVILSGCLLPPAYQIASWTMSGFSYLFTGKSVSDHALSIAFQKDCAIHRVVVGSRACLLYAGEPFDDLTAVALLGDELEEASVYQVAQDPVTLPSQMGDLVSVLGAAAKPTMQPEALAVLPLLEKNSAHRRAPEEIVVAAKTDSPWRSTVTAPTRSTVAPPRRLRTVLWTASNQGATQDSRGLYLVIGSFLSITNAERLREVHSDFGAAVLHIERAGKTWHRVAAGPFAFRELAKAKAYFTTVGISKSWVLQR